jgi:hypothetical protein
MNYLAEGTRLLALQYNILPAHGLSYNAQFRNREKLAHNAGFGIHNPVRRPTLGRDN